VASPPVIDIHELRAGAAAAELVQAVDAACTEIGLFVVTGHGLERQLDDVFRAAQALFGLPEAAKESLAMVDRQGFVPARHRALDTALHTAPMEYYDVGRSGGQRWPSASDLPDFEPTSHGAATCTTPRTTRSTPGHDRP
jgi:isopenicillin N synthase-like dioxygenase